MIAFESLIGQVIEKLSLDDLTQMVTVAVDAVQKASSDLIKKLPHLYYLARRHGVEEFMIKLEVWLYGPLAQYAREESAGSYAQLLVELPAGTKMRDLLDQLGMPLEKKGITFINAQLTDMPGLAADLERELQDGDRIGFFHERSMWPFQYRFGASTSSELKEAMHLRHSSTSKDRETKPPTE